MAGDNLPKLRLNLDCLYSEGYYYTDFDIGGAGHSITVEGKDREAFLDALAAEWRKKAEALLEPVEEEDG